MLQVAVLSDKTSCPSLAENPLPKVSVYATLACWGRGFGGWGRKATWFPQLARQFQLAQLDLAFEALRRIADHTALADPRLEIIDDQPH